jgi:hypothetical protein
MWLVLETDMIQVTYNMTDQSTSEGEDFYSEYND